MLLLATMAFGQAKEDAGDGKMLDKQTMEFKDYLPEIHGTIRGKYEYQTETSESRFEVRNARFSVSGNVHPIVAYKAEIDLSDPGILYHNLRILRKHSCFVLLLILHWVLFPFILSSNSLIIDFPAQKNNLLFPVFIALALHPVTREKCRKYRQHYHNGE